MENSEDHSTGEFIRVTYMQERSRKAEGDNEHTSSFADYRRWIEESKDQDLEFLNKVAEDEETELLNQPASTDP
jgi:hypothetical protein